MQQRVRRTAAVSRDVAAAGDAAITAGDYESWSRLVDIAVARQLHDDTLDRFNRHLADLDAGSEADLIARVHAATATTLATWSALRGPR